MKILPLVITSFLAYGCAAKKIAAENADYFIERQIEKRLPLYSFQKKELSQDVNAFLNSQKETTQQALPLLSIEFDAAKTDQRYDELETVYNKYVASFSQLISKYQAQLDQKQQKEFEETLKKENKDLAKASNDDRLEKFQDRFKTLFGSISPEQVKMIKSYKSQITERHESRLDRRKKLHVRFSEIYQMDLSPSDRVESFVTAYTDYQKSYAYALKNKEMIRQMIPTLSQKQKVFFDEKIKDFKEILSYYLAAEY